MKTQKWVPDVDYEKTIAEGRLAYKRSLRAAIGDSIFEILAVMITVAVIIDLLRNNRADFSILIIVTIADIFLLINLILSYKLVKVVAGNELKNKEDMINVLRYFYNDLTFGDSKQNILRDIRLSTYSSGGRVITVLFKDSDVYIHRTSLGKASSILHFGIFNYYRCKTIAEEFKRMQTDREKYVFRDSFI